MRDSHHPVSEHLPRYTHFNKPFSIEHTKRTINRRRIRQGGENKTWFLSRNTEARARKHCKQVFKIIFEFLQVSSIHGAVHLTARSRHWSEHLLWCTCLVSAIAGATYISSISWKRFQMFPSVISIENDYKNWNTSFPTIMICPQQQVDLDKLQALASKYGVQDTQKFVDFFGKLSIVNYGDFHTLDDYQDVSSDKFMEILISARFNFSIQLSHSYDGGSHKLVEVVTETGVCHSYNSDISKYFTPQNFFKKKPPETPKLKKGLDYLNPLDGEVFLQFMSLNSGYNMSVCGPYDLPDVSMARLKGERFTYKDVETWGFSINSAESVRDLSVSQRKCRYYEESDLDISHRYTYLLCRMQCRLDQAYRLCNCVPHFYRKTKDKPFCDVKGLKCLDNHADYLINLRDPDTNTKVPCNCYPLCDDTHFVITADTTRNWDKTNIRVTMDKYPKIRLLRETIFGFADLLVSVGGSAGLFLGCSVLSFIEIIYYFTLRLIVNHLSQRRQQHSNNNW